MKNKLFLKNILKITDRDNGILVSRAAWAIYAVLKVNRLSCKVQKIALPSFICHSPLIAVISAGWDPIFCDVNINTGSVDEREWLAALDKGIDAILHSQLFGNFENPSKLSKACKDKGILFIEDSAQSFGAIAENIPSGCSGDVSVLSFGYTKLLDAGSGGALLAHDKLLLREIKRLQSSQENENLFINHSSILKNKIYNAKSELTKSISDAKKLFADIGVNYPGILFPSLDYEFVNKATYSLENIAINIANRRKKYELYCTLLKDTPLVPMLPIGDSVVPWRAAFRLPNQDYISTYSISDLLRSNKIDVSNWYLPSHWIYRVDESIEGRLVGTNRLSSEVIQFWLDESIGYEKIKHDCKIIKRELRNGK